MQERNQEHLHSHQNPLTSKHSLLYKEQVYGVRNTGWGNGVLVAVVLLTLNLTDGDNSQISLDISICHP